MRTTAGYLFMAQTYSLNALTIEELLHRLRSKNLIIDNQEQALHCLKTIGYHRLSSYFDPFKTYHLSEWKFKPSASFNAIWQLYNFDRELRLLVTDALERIEVTFRAVISDTMSLHYEPHWYLNASLFKRREMHDSLLQQVNDVCRRQEDPQIKQYYHQYCHPEFPPSWIIIENLSFGACVTTFRNLKLLSDKKAICEIFGYHPTAIESWLDALRYTRNLCAHHSRLWNRWFVVAPKLSYLYGDQFHKERSFYAQAIIINRLLQVISPGSQWQAKLYALFNKNDLVPIYKMGFIENWHDDLFWENNNLV